MQQAAWRSMLTQGPRSVAGRPCRRLTSGNPAGRTSASKSARWPAAPAHRWPPHGDRKSTRLNSSHSQISYAVFCLKKKKKKKKKKKYKQTTRIFNSTKLHLILTHYS